MKRIVELRSAEGGEDAKLFAKDLAVAYSKLFSRFGWKHRPVDCRNGDFAFEVEGDDLTALYNEVGGHRVQRIPPTEKRGRVHSSTVTVAVIDSNVPSIIHFNEREFKIEWYSGTGAGGQHRNKHQNSCRITHITTGIVATAQCRSRENSFEEAKSSILQRLNHFNSKQVHDVISVDRKEQVGSGQRGDKVRTYRFQDNIATDHRSSKKTTTDKIMSGNFDLLWK